MNGRRHPRKARDASVASSTFFFRTPTHVSVSIERPVGPAVRPVPASSEWRPPERVGKYRVGHCIGSGGMGKVYLARDTTIDREVALKFILDPGSKDPAAIERLRREARVLGKLNNPNVLVIYDDGEVDGTPYLVTELVKGQRLDRMAKPLAPVLVRQIGIGVAFGLAAAHEGDILHRDVKPSNVILGHDGVIKVLDFGIAKIIRGGEPLSTRAPASLVIPTPLEASPPAVATDTLPSPGSTGEGQSYDDDMPSLTGVSLMGSPPYMAPELWCGVPPSRQSDVYALGALLFELCAGHPPHGVGSIPDLRHAILERDAPPLASLVPSVEPALAEVVAKCLQRDPAARYASATEVYEALQAVPEGNPYRGVLPFQAEHRALFFGRTRDVEGILAKLAIESFVVVVGAARVGKTSVCRAGVLPAARADGIAGRPCAVIDLTPGRLPLRALAERLAPCVGVDATEIVNRLSRDPEAIDGILAQRPAAGTPLLIFIDQLEDLASSADRREQEIVASVIARISRGEHGIRILATLRADGAGAVPRPLGAFIDDRTRYPLAPLGREGLREAILAPWRAAGGAFNSDALAETLIDRAESMTDGLPLLANVLAKAWQTRDRTSRSITHATLRAITPSLLDDEAGFAVAFGQHAEEVIQGMAAERPEARRILLALASSPEGPLLRRSRRELLDGGPLASTALDGLVRGNVVLRCSDTTPDPVYELAHPALLSCCETLKRWLDEEVRCRPARQRLEVAAEHWDKSRARRELWSEGELEELRNVDVYDLTQRALEFRAASREEADRKRRRGAYWKHTKRLAARLAFGAAMFHMGHRHGDAVGARFEALARAGATCVGMIFHHP